MVLTMSAIRWVLIVFVAISWPISTGTKVEILKKCCNLGTNYADEGLKCTSFQAPIAGISKEDEAFCLNSVGVCCKKQYREKQCQIGQNNAQSGKSCASSTDDAEKECCEACEMGLETGSSGQSCQSDLGLGALMDAAYESCCKTRSQSSTSSTSTSTSTTTSTTTTTEEPQVSKRTKSLEKYDEDNPPPLPSLEALCEIPELCAHICIPTVESFKCECHEGFTLMSDGVSCKPKKRSSPNSKRCGPNNPCDHHCIDTGVAIKCSCFTGYELASDKKTCKDIDECELGIHECLSNEICVNLEGEYDCESTDDADADGNIGFDDKCPEGYKFDGEQMVCNDINECEIGLVCPKPGTCINTIGSFKCEDDTPKCPPGFFYKDSIESCDDIDECITGVDDCNRESQTCLNTKGNYTCIDKASKRTCPPGFKKNAYTQECEDINECLENDEICGENEECINEPGGHNCVPKLTTKPSSTSNPDRSSVFNSQPTNPAESRPPSSAIPIPSKPPTPEETQPNAIDNYPPPQPTYPKFVPTPSQVYPQSQVPPITTVRGPTIQQSVPSQIYPQPPSVPSQIYPQPSSVPSQQPTENQPRLPQPSYQPPPRPQTSQQPNYFQPPYYQSNKPVLPPFIPPNHRVSCPTGHRFSDQTTQCVDIDECAEDEEICDSNQDCYNTVGSYICNCKNGFTKDYQTGACVDINECQVGQHDCGDGQRCDNTIGSFLCSRTTGCGTGYTLNSATGLCEDDDECIIGSHNCRDLGPKFQCRNTLGSYRCERIKCIGDCYIRRVFTTTATSSYVPPKVEPTQTYPAVISQLKKCLPGYRMNQNGVCEDINECDSSPCKRGEQCLNLNGRFQCIPYVQCKSGYELNEAGTGCIDINECTRGTHKCKQSQICKNGPGYYICQCPPGHKLNPSNECEDINECEFYRERICSRNSQCVNTVGSYKCKCKEGFRENSHSCDDIDECTETPGLCHQNCVNLWGSYRCSCERGFTLSVDNRTCADIDECDKFKDKNLCVGTCQNTPGSYSCKCPEGYRLGADGRTCQDVDECQRHVCRSPEDVCVNTRGGFKCHTITCPPHYIKDPEHKSRCKRASNVCDIRDINCIRMPGQYSYHFVAFVSNLPIPDEGKIEFFQMKGPAWASSNANFDMSVMNVKCPRQIQQADENYFRMKRDANKVVVSLVRSIEGPQEIELQLQMELYVSGVFQGKVVSTVFVLVSEYEY